MAAPRDGSQRPAAPRNSPSATVPQTEPMDLDGGKSPQQMFSSACVVCHQSPQGLAKGRGAGQLGSFLRFPDLRDVSPGLCYSCIRWLGLIGFFFLGTL